MNANSKPPIRIVFAENSYLIREGTRALIKEIDELDLLDVATNETELLGPPSYI